MARTKSPSASSAILDFEATALRDSAGLKREAILQSVSAAKDNFGPENADTFRRDLHPDLRADTALRDSAFLQRKASPQIVSEATNNSGL